MCVGDDLARHLAGGDVFVFPSKTDTYGLVMLEAMACGLPVAALPVEGPIDVVENGVTGAQLRDRARQNPWQSVSREQALLASRVCR